MNSSRASEFGAREVASRTCAVCGIRVAAQSFTGATSALLKHVRAQHWKHAVRTSGAIERVPSRGRRGRVVEERTALRARPPTPAPDLTLLFESEAELRSAALVVASDWIVLPASDTRQVGDNVRLSITVGKQHWLLQVTVVDVTAQATPLYITAASAGWSMLAATVCGPGVPGRFPRGTTSRMSK